MTFYGPSDYPVPGGRLEVFLLRDLVWCELWAELVPGGAGSGANRSLAVAPGTWDYFDL